MASFLIIKFELVFNRKNDSLSQASFSVDLEEFGKYQVDQRDVMFQMVDPSFDNDVNPYLEFKFRMTTLIDGEFKKTYLPVVKCENEFLHEFQTKQWYTGQFYCPQFD